MIGIYATPAAYRQALEQRVRAAAKQLGLDMSRHRQVLIYDRFLARVFAEFGESAILKGGVVIELRLERARTTRDVDLRLTGNPANVLGSLQRAGATRSW
jgi:predicted nucleotidyltransferase component of viral defense system